MIIKGQLSSALDKQIVAIVGEVSAAQLSDAIEVLHDDGSELSDDEQARLRGLIAAAGLPHTEAQRKAIEARAMVSVRRLELAGTLRAYKAAYEAWGRCRPYQRSDPEVEWDSPATEEEAAGDLAVAYLGGQVVAARCALESAEKDARLATRAAMKEAALLGRDAWRKAH